MKFKDSKLAHRYLDGLSGLEIGGSAHNPFNLNTLNVDYTDDMDTVFKQAEQELCGEKMRVDIVAYGDALPVKDNSVDFVISSHVAEHIFDTLKAFKEWYRVVKNGGYVLTIVPITSHVPNEIRPTTTIEELIKRHNGEIKEEFILQRVSVENSQLSPSIVEGILYDTKHGHWTVFDLNLLKQICDYLNFNIIELLERDDKVGNGHLLLIQK
jgi:SAM-dependent methyltransferase